MFSGFINSLKAAATARLDAKASEKPVKATAKPKIREMDHGGTYGDLIMFVEVNNEPAAPQKPAKAAKAPKFVDVTTLVVSPFGDEHLIPTVERQKVVKPAKAKAAPKFMYTTTLTVSPFGDDHLVPEIVRYKVGK